MPGRKRASAEPPRIYVLAGVNGAGKSSVGGAALRETGADYFNPDEATRRILGAQPGLSLDEANSRAWLEGKRLLERAIHEHLDFAFETTLGGNTMTQLLETALAKGLEVRVWFVGLESPELHVKRVRAHVAKGGHDIPEATIRERFDRSRLNLIRLLPHLTELRVFDNSSEGDPARGRRPRTRLLLHCVMGVVQETCALDEVPGWAKPIVASALRRR